jgi:hypothetical protein
MPFLGDYACKVSIDSFLGALISGAVLVGSFLGTLFASFSSFTLTGTVPSLSVQCHCQEIYLFFFFFKFLVPPPFGPPDLG